MWDFSPLLLRGHLCNYNHPLICGLPNRSMVSTTPHLHPSFSSCCVSVFISSVVEDLSCKSSSFSSSTNCYINSFNFDVSVGGSELSTYTAISATPQDIDFEMVTLSWVIWVLEKTFESPLDSKEIQPVNPKGNQS